eukprot:2089973-Rhodomonas_salina.1
MRTKALTSSLVSDPSSLKNLRQTQTQTQRQRQTQTHRDRAETDTDTETETETDTARQQQRERERESETRCKPLSHAPTAAAKGECVLLREGAVRAQHRRCECQRERASARERGA